MVTIYDLLEVSEDASKEEIEKAYQNMIISYQTNPSFSEEENKENEFILNKLKMAYDILINDEKRKKYDENLANKRAEDLIKNVSTTTVEENHYEDPIKVSNETVPEQEEKIQESKTEMYDREFDDGIEENSEELTKQEREKLKQAAEDEFKRNLAKVKKAEEEYNKAYNKAYKEYVKSNDRYSFRAKLKRFGVTLLFILVLIVVCFILWHIPPVKASLANIYNSNVVIKTIVDIIVSVVNSFK